MELLPAAARLPSPSPSVLHPLTAAGAVSPGKVASSVSVRRAPLRLLQLSHASPHPSLSLIASAAAGLPAASTSSRWVVDMEKPPGGVASSRAGVIDYYVDTLSKILGDEREAQVCIYDASWQTEFRFCCYIDQEASKELADLPCVLSVRPDTNFESIKSSRYPNSLSKFLSRSEDPSPIFAVSQVNSGYWMVKMRKPGVEVVTKAQVVDYYADTLTKVLGNEKDAQACIYHISWEKDFGFCCQIDEECARELADVPEVVRVCPDINFDSKNKDYGGVDSSQKSDVRELPESGQIPNIKTKRLFVTGLSFYTSEKTLRAAFEGFGELVEVKIIMDRISKRSKGYAFIEYTTEDAASAALKEMNGKIINGWMIVVDVAKANPPSPRYSREGRRPSNSASSSY